MRSERRWQNEDPGRGCCWRCRVPSQHLPVCWSTDISSPSNVCRIKLGSTTVVTEEIASIATHVQLSIIFARSNYIL
jgi:hypothetical protein